MTSLMESVFELAEWSNEEMSKLAQQSIWTRKLWKGWWTGCEKGLVATRINYNFTLLKTLSMSRFTLYYILWVTLEFHFLNSSSW